RGPLLESGGPRQTLGKLHVRLAVRSHLADRELKSGRESIDHAFTVAADQPTPVEALYGKRSFGACKQTFALGFAPHPRIGSGKSHRVHGLDIKAAAHQLDRVGIALLEKTRGRHGDFEFEIVIGQSARGLGANRAGSSLTPAVFNRLGFDVNVDSEYKQ